MNTQYRNEIETRLRQQGLHHVLEPLYTSVLAIPERLYAYNSDMFICRNLVDRTYEVHSLQNKERTFCMTVPFDELDERILQRVWKLDIRVHGAKLFSNLEKSEEEFEKRKERERKNWIEDVAKESQSYFAKDAWTFGT